MVYWRFEWRQGGCLQAPLRPLVSFDDQYVFLGEGSQRKVDIGFNLRGGHPSGVTATVSLWTFTVGRNNLQVSWPCTSTSGLLFSHGTAEMAWTPNRKGGSITSTPLLSSEPFPQHRTSCSLPQQQAQQIQSDLARFNDRCGGVGIGIEPPAVQLAG